MTKLDARRIGNEAKIGCQEVNVPEQQFEPIVMTGCDEESVRKKGRKIYRFPFCLSNKPPREWEECFVQQWRSRRKQNSAQKAKAYVRKNELVLFSSLDDVGFHFANLRSDIEAANKQYIEHVKEKDGRGAEKKRKREERLAAERRAIHAALEGLTFKKPKGTRSTAQQSIAAPKKS